MTDFARQYMLSGPEDSQSITTLVASQIGTGSLKFSDFIASVQEYAVDDDLTIQAKSIGYISAVLALLKPDTLPRIEISVLVAFLRTRIEDNAGAKEASQGLRTLMQMNRFMKKDSVEIMDTLFKNTANLQRQPVSARFAIYHLVEKSLELCREVLEGMGNRFIDGVLSLVEFEKDPRNLMIVFSSLRVIMAEFPATESQTAALWDAVFRYYPISYRPNPENNIQITKQDLQQRLEACLTSNSRFAPFAFPSLLAKLDQEIGVTVKIETLKTFSACVMAYSPAAVASYAGQAWSLIKYDAYSQMDPTAALQAALALKCLVSKTFEQEDDDGEAAESRTSNAETHLSSNEQSPAVRLLTEGPPPNFDFTPKSLPKKVLVNLAVKDILDSMATPTVESSRKAGLIMTAVASGSPVAFSLVLKSTMPALLTLWQEADGKIADMSAILKLFNSVLDDANFNKGSAFYDPPSGNDTQLQKMKCVDTLAAFKEQLNETFEIALSQQEVPLKITAIEGLVKLACVPCLLSYDELGMTVQSLASIAMTLSLESKVREAATSGLLLLSSIPQCEIRGNLAHENSTNSSSSTSRDGAELIERIVFPKMLAATTLQANNPSLPNHNATLVELYMTWYVISPEVRVFGAFLRAMMGQLEMAISGSRRDMLSIALSALRLGLTHHIEHFKKSSGGLKFPLNGSPIDYVQYVRELFKLVVVQDEDSCTVMVRQYPNGLYLSNRVLQIVGYIAMHVFSSIEAAQQVAADELFTLFVADGLKTSNKFSQWDNMRNLSSEQRRPIILTMHILASLRPDAKLLVAYDVLKFADDLIQAIEIHGAFDSSINNNSAVMLAFAECLAILVNKFELKSVESESQEVALDTRIRALLSSCFKHGSPSCSVEQAKPIAYLALYYIIAMVKKGDDGLYYTKKDEDQLPFLNYVISLFSVKGGEPLQNGEVSAGGNIIAGLFGLILKKSTTQLTKRNHAVRSAHHQKKFYGHFYPALVKFMDSHQSCLTTQKNCLVALTGVIEHISGEDFVLKTNPITVMLKILGLDLQSGSKRAALQLMITAARSNPQMLSSHYHSVMDRLNQRMKDTDPIVRAMAVHCLACLASAPKEPLNRRYKPKVLVTLGMVVGDVDSRVRSEAVDCRNKWAAIDVPSDE